MKQAAKPFPVLGVTRKLPPLERKIANPLNLNGFRTVSCKTIKMTSQHKTVRIRKISGNPQGVTFHG